MTSEVAFESLNAARSQQQHHQPLQQSNQNNVQPDAQFEFPPFTRTSTGSFDSSDPQYNGTIQMASPYPVQMRRASQQELVGSPASSYTPSVSDGRQGSISFQQPTFKVPVSTGFDRRGSLPAVIPNSEHFTNPSGFTGQQSIPRDMHNTQWTPNFSFGSANSRPETSAVPKAVAASYQAFPQQNGHASVYALPQDGSLAYNFDRRMSHPVLPTGTFDAAPMTVRPRQGSAIDWRTYNNMNQRVDRSADGTGMNGQFSGADGLWNTLDSARGMVAMAQQGPNSKSYAHNAATDSLDDQFKQHMARRRSMPYLSNHKVINEEPTAEQFDDQYDNSTVYGSHGLDLSDDGSVSMQPSLGPDGKPDQASMMTTFNAKDTNSGHKKHICPVCKKRFTRPSSLTTHIYSHTGEKPFICEVANCGRHFSVISNLRRHRKIHLAGSQTPAT